MGGLLKIKRKIEEKKTIIEILPKGETIRGGEI